MNWYTVHGLGRNQSVGCAIKVYIIVITAHPRAFVIENVTINYRFSVVRDQSP